MISNDKIILKAKEDEQILICKKVENHRKEFMYQQSNKSSVNEEEYNNAIIEVKASGKIIMHDIIFINQWLITNKQNYENPFNEQITQAIQNHRIKAVTDASCKTTKWQDIGESSQLIEASSSRTHFSTKNREQIL